MLGLTLISLLAVDGGTAPPPRALSCLGRWYVGQVAHTADGGWGWALPDDGGVVPWEDGVPSDGGTDEEGLAAAPDLHDVFAVPYVAGPIKVIEGSGKIEDPGRARIEQLFKTTYGSTSAEVQQHLNKVRFFGLRYPFHERAAPALERVVERLDALVKVEPKVLPFLKNIGGTWMWRRIKRSKSLSAHAWGIAIDINVARSAYWRWAEPREPIKWQNKVPQPVVDAFEAEGFIWGGRWLHYDTMHFEYRPELLDPACREAE